MITKLSFCFAFAILFLLLRQSSQTYIFVQFVSGVQQNTNEPIIKTESSNGLKIRQNQTDDKKQQNKIGQKNSSSLPQNQGISSDLSMTYEEYLRRYKSVKNFRDQNQEYQYRQLIFYDNLNKIIQHNHKKQNAYVKKLNQYADVEEQEFIIIHGKLLITSAGTSIELNNLYYGDEDPPIAFLQSSNILKQAQPGKQKELKATKSEWQDSKNAKISSSSNISSSFSQKSGTDLQTTPSVNSTPSSDNIRNAIVENVTIDWSCKTSQIMDQGLCGSCFAIAPLESIYVTHRIHGKDLFPLSVQEVISCGDHNLGIYGCLGGYFFSVFNYAKRQGVGMSIIYPYQSQSIGYGLAPDCNRRIMTNQFYKKNKIKILDYKEIEKGNCQEVINQLKVRSIAVSIGISDLQFYYYGTYNRYSSAPNHGVTLVGYNSENNEFKIKNSWGRTWGDFGFGYVGVESGVCDYAMYPIIEGQKTIPSNYCT